ncbi:MAG: GAF domain-containing protein [Nitrospiraceae bacterium]|nr:GAF domain-containing protein [Nitrospiraceae bacterium]
MSVAPAYTLNVHAIPMLLMGLVTLGLGVLVYRSNRQSASHRHFLILCASIALWLTATSIGLCATTADRALNWFRLDNVGVMYISVAFYAFSSEFLQLHRPRSILLGYGLATLLAGAVLVRQDFVAGVHQYWWGYFPQWGPASVPFFALFFSYMAVAFTDYVRAYGTVTTPIKRQQIRFVLIAFVIAYLGSVDFVPALGYALYPFGYVPIFLLTIIVTIAILRYQLLDAALFVSLSATYLPLVPFTLALVLLANGLSDLSPAALTGTLVAATATFTVLYVTFQPRLQSALNKALFPGRHDAYNTLARFSQTMVTNLDLANLQNEIVRALQHVMGIEKISLFLLEKEDGRYGLKASYGIDKAQANAIQLTSHESFSGFLVEHNQPIIKEELQHGLLGKDEALTAALVEVLTKMDSEVCLPLVNKARLIGFVNLGHKPLLAIYSLDEIKLLGSLANNAAIALDNAMLYEDWKRSQLLIRRTDRLRSLETIAGGFAHEIRNPLTSIKTFIQLAPLRRDDAEFMDSFSPVVADDLARIERLIEEILDYARYMKPKFSLESLNEIVSSCLHFIEVKANSLGVSIEKHLAEQLTPIVLDRQQIKQVLMNLVLNAIDAMKTGGRLSVATRDITRLDGTQWIQIEISDTGSGITPEDLPHIFDPFFTTKHDSAEHAGTGLGLSIVHQIIQEHTGTIEAQSTVGQGTVFIITLPHKTDLDSVPAPAASTWQGKLLPFPSIPPLLRNRTGTHGP